MSNKHLYNSFAKNIERKIVAQLKTHIPQQKIDFYKDNFDFEVKSTKDLSGSEIERLMTLTWGENSESMMSSFLKNLKQGKSLDSYVCLCYKEKEIIGWALLELKPAITDEMRKSFSSFKEALMAFSGSKISELLSKLTHSVIYLEYKEVETILKEIINEVKSDKYDQNFQSRVENCVYFADEMLYEFSEKFYDALYNTYVDEKYRDRRIGSACLAKLKEFVNSKNINIDYTQTSPNFKETPFASDFYGKNFDFEKDKYESYYTEYPHNEKQLNLFSKINKFFKVAGLTLTDDLANHIYVNNILQKLPRENWPEVYVNYGIEGADNAIKYGVEALIGRIKRDRSNTHLTNEDAENLAHKMRSNPLDLTNYSTLKKMFLDIGYNSDYRKPWLITIGRLVDLVKDKKELQKLIVSKADPILIFNKKVEVNLSLNMFYDSAHSNGSFLERLSDVEFADHRNLKAKKIRDAIHILDNSFIEARDKFKNKIQTIKDRSVAIKLTDEFKRFEKEYNAKKAELLEAERNIGKKTQHRNTSKEDLVRLLDSSRLLNPEDVSYFTKQHMHNPGKYNEHHEYTNFSEKKHNPDRLNKGLLDIRIKTFINAYIKSAKPLLEFIINNNSSDNKINEKVKALKSLSNSAFYSSSEINTIGEGKEEQRVNQYFIEKRLHTMNNLCNYLTDTIFNSDYRSTQSILVNRQKILQDLENEFKELENHVEKMQ